MMLKLHKVILLSILNIGCSLTQITHTGTATGTVTGLNGAGTFTGTGTATGTGLGPVYSGTYTSTGTVTGIAPVANCDVAYVEDTIYEDDVCVDDTYDYVVEDIPLTPGYISDPLQTQSTILYLLQELIIRRDKLVDAYLNIGGDPTVLQGMYGIGTECNLFPYEDYAVGGPVVCDEVNLVPDVVYDNVAVLPEVVYDDLYAVPDVVYTDYAVPLPAPVDEVVSYDTIYDVPIAVPEVCEDVIEDTMIQDPSFVSFSDGNGIYLGDGNANEDDLFQIGDNTCICMSEDVMQNFIASDVYSTLSDRGITGNPLLSLAGGQQVNLNGDCNGFFNLGSQECICYGNDVLTSLPAPAEECEFRFDYPNIQTPRKPAVPAPVSPPKEEVCEKPTEKVVPRPAPAPAPVSSPKGEVCEEPVQKPVKPNVKYPKQPVQEKPKQAVPVYPKAPAPAPAPAPEKDVPCEEDKKPLMKKKKVLIPKKTAPVPAPQESQPTKDATVPAPKPSKPKVKKETVPKKPTPAEECVVPKEPQQNPGSKKPTPMKKKKVAIPKPAPTECVEKEAPVKPGPAPNQMKKKIPAAKPDNKPSNPSNPSKPSKPVETPCTIRDLKKKGQENTAKKAAPAPAPTQPVPSRKSVAPPIVKKKPEEVCVETPAVPSRPGKTPSKPVATPSYPKPGSGIPSKPPAKKDEVCEDKPKTPTPVYPKPGTDIPSKAPGKTEEKCEDPSKAPTSSPKSPTSTSPKSPGKPDDKPCDADSIQKEAIQLFMKDKSTSAKH